MKRGWVRRAGRLVRRSVGRTRSGAMFRGAAAAGAARAVRNRIGRRLPVSGKRRRYYTRSVAKRRRVDSQPTSGGQWYRRRMVTGRKKGILAKTVYASTEPIVLRSRNVKTFNDNGAQTIFKQSTNAGADTELPIYALCLNPNVLASTTGDRTGVFRQLRYANADGRFRWQTRFLQSNTGTTATISHPYAEIGRAIAAERSLVWRYCHIKMNLWGARQRAVRFTVQICKVTSKVKSPFFENSNATIDIESQQIWEEMVKQYTFNPIMTVNWNNAKGVKVLKTFDTVIQPVETTDGDQDPKCVQLDWYTKWYRNVSYRNYSNDSATGTTNAALSFNAPGEANVGVIANSTFPTDADVVFLLIRASDYLDPAVNFDNNVHGSFDFDVRHGYTHDGI